MILFGIYPSLSKCLEDKCYKFEDFNSNYKSKVSPENSIHKFSKKTKIKSFRNTEILGKFYLRDNLRLEKLLASLTSTINKEENQIINKKQFVDIQSDSSTSTKKKYIAEGNVRALTPYGIFYADKISYDFEKEIFVAEGNISFIKNNQYLEASKLEYDFLNKKGYIDNLYGIVNLRKFNMDINDKEYNYKNLVEENIISEISNPRYLDASKLSFANDYDYREEEEEEEDEEEDLNDVEKLAPFFKETKFSTDIETLSRWRLKTDKLLLNNGIFTSEKIFFTNDIYNKPQLIIKTIDLEGELVDESLDLTGRRNYFIFDDKFTLPLGRRRISATNSGTWGIASDTEEKDGFYIFRTLDEIELPFEYKLNLTPQYLLQRSLQGHTDSFRPSNSAIFDDNVESDNSVFDLFGLDATLKGKIFSWDLKIYSQLNSLDLDRFEQAYRSKITLSKTIDLITYRYLQKKKIKENKRIRANIKKLLNQNVCLKEKEQKNIDQLEKERDELIIARAYLDNSLESIKQAKKLNKKINLIQGKIIKEKENQFISKLENLETISEAEVKQLLNQSACLKDKGQKNIDQLEKERDELMIARAYLDNSLESIEEAKRLNKKINFIQGQLIKEKENQKFIENKIVKLILQKNIYKDLRKLDLQDKKDRKIKLTKDEVTFEFYKSYREKVDKGFSGEKNIYKGKGVRIENKKTLKNKKNRQFNMNLNFDLGIFEAKRNGKKELIKARRLFKNISLGYKQPLITSKNPELFINEENIYYPKVISQGLYWDSDIDAGIFAYEDHSTQKVLKLSTGPVITFGKFKETFFDYTKIMLKREQVYKNGESIFDFDDESEMPRYKLKFEQQLMGPLIFTFSSYINLEDDEDSIYGDFKSVRYGLQLRRRAYSVSIFAKPDVDSNFESGTYGVSFNIFNFDYSGISPKF